MSSDPSTLHCILTISRLIGTGQVRDSTLCYPRYQSGMSVGVRVRPCILACGALRSQCMYPLMSPMSNVRCISSPGHVCVCISVCVCVLCTPRTHRSPPSTVVLWRTVFASCTHSTYLKVASMTQACPSWRSAAHVTRRSGPSWYCCACCLRLYPRDCSTGCPTQ